MKRSQRLENMFSSYGYEITSKFLDCFEIFYHFDAYGIAATSQYLIVRHNGRNYRLSDEMCLSFHVEKDNPYGVKAAFITFNNTEEQIINKFERFLTLKAFL